MGAQDSKHFIRIVYPSIWFVVDYSWKYNDDGRCTWVEYTAYKAESLDEESTEVSCKDEIFMNGFIKWDGCTEFVIDQHVCGYLQIQQLQVLFDELYMKASEIFKLELEDLK